MDEYKFTNNAKGQLSAGISDVATSLSLKAGEGAEFPSLSGNQYFMCTLVDTSGNREIIKVTAISGDNFTTIVRAQEGTSGRAFSTDDKVELRVTAGFLNDLVTMLSVTPDFNGLEVILDADGDSSLTADTDDQLDLKLGGDDIWHWTTGAFKPEDDDTVDIGATDKQIKDLFVDGVAYIDEFDIDGSNKASFPTNGVGSDALFMMGLNTTIIWMYLNVAPPGWKVLTTGENTVLGVKATAKSSGTADSDSSSHLVDSGADFVSDGVVVGDVAYNLDDNTSALVTNVAAQDLTLDSDAFPDGDEQYEVGSRFIDPGGNQADKASWSISGLTVAAHVHQWYKYTDQTSDDKFFDSGGNPVDIDSRLQEDKDDNYYRIDPTVIDDTGNISNGSLTDLYTDDASPTASGDGLWKPAASIGKLMQLDTA